MFQTMDMWIWFCGMGKNSEVENGTGRVICGADIDHVMAKAQLRYRESTNPRIPKMPRTVPTLTTRGGRTVSAALTPSIPRVCEGLDKNCQCP